jgi:hypothetical protein
MRLKYEPSSETLPRVSMRNLASGPQELPYVYTAWPTVEPMDYRFFVSLLLGRQRYPESQKPKIYT